MRQIKPKVKIGIIGTDSYSNKRKLKDFLFKSIQKFDVEIVGCGKEDGFDKVLRNLCQEMKIRIGEFPPFYSSYTHLCVLPKRMYNKSYNQRYKYGSIKAMINYCDFIVFCEEGTENFSEEYKYAKKYCKKVDKISRFL